MSKAFTISRTFNAPRELVWEVWTNPELMAKWFGPKGLAIGTYKMDFRPGGTYHYSMVATEVGFTMWGKFIYREIEKPSKLVYINTFSDENGGLGRHPMAPEWPQQLLSTITFTEENGKTTLSIHWLPYEATASEIKTFEDGMDSMNMGWSGTLDQLAEFLDNTQKGE